MTSLRALIADVPEITAAAAADDAGTTGRASESALRLALHLRDAPAARPGGRALVFVPASRTVDASRVVGDAVQGLLALRQGPVLVMDLRGEADDAAANTARREPNVPATCNQREVQRPFAGRRDAVPYAASDEFALHFADARARFSYVLCIGEPLEASVTTLITASLSDGVILSVAPGRTTRSEVQRVTEQLRRARAHVMGFVVEARHTERID